MTLNEVNIIKNAVLDATEAYVDARLSNSPFVKTQIGVVSTDPVKNSNQKYEHTVVCNKTATTAGITYTKVLSVGNIPFPKNSVVFIISPNAQFSNQFILGKLDSSPANILGGEIHIGQIGNTEQYYFNVNNTGNVTIKGTESSIQLAQDENTGYYHVNLDKNGIKLGHTGSGSYNFVVNGSTGNVTIKKGTINLGNNFIVTDAGLVTIKSGSINLGNNFIVTDAGVVTIKNGSIDLGNNFIVTDAGNVTIKKGSIDLGGGAFTVTDLGEVTATKGSIGGFEIGTNSIGTGDAIFTKDRFGCGKAPYGIINLVGNNGNAYIQISNDGDPTSIPDIGIRIYQDGTIYSPNWSDNERYLSNIPEKTIYEDSTGYLKWA